MELEIRKIGRSKGVVIPNALLKKLGCEVGQAMQASIVKGRLVLEKAQEPEYSLEELLALASPESKAWDAGEIKRFRRYVKQKAYERVRELVKEKQERPLTLEELVELKECFEIHDKKAQANKIASEIASIRLEGEAASIDEDYDFSELEKNL